MRTKTENNITVQYADEIGFAFMPCILKANGGGITAIKLALSTEEGGSVTCKADAYKGSCILDYRAYVQALFDAALNIGYIKYYNELEKDKLGMDVTFNVSVEGDSGTLLSFDFSTFYAWGAMRYGESWGGCQHLTWFKNFPFSFGLYADAATKILIGFEGAPQKYLEIEGRGIYNIMSRNLNPSARYSVIYNYDGEIKQAQFDSFFDLTFYLKGGVQERLLRIDYDDTEGGIYLRWIDRHGFYRYWLFTAGDESREVAGDGEFMRNNLWGYQDISGYLGALGRRQGYSRTDTIPLCAPSVDSDTFDMLQDLTSSPVVDLYLGGDAGEGEDRWKSVTINANTYTKTGAPLQDFVCTMVLTDINIQGL